jgi:hypothetical protein
MTGIEFQTWRPRIFLSTPENFPVDAIPTKKWSTDREIGKPREFCYFTVALVLSVFSCWQPDRKIGFRILLSVFCNRQGNFGFQ